MTRFPLMARLLGPAAAAGCRSARRSATRRSCSVHSSFGVSCAGARRHGRLAGGRERFLLFGVGGATVEILRALPSTAPGRCPFGYLEFFSSKEDTHDGTGVILPVGSAGPPGQLPPGRRGLAKRPYWKI